MLKVDHAGDAAIRDVYASIPDTADEIVSDPDLSVEFCHQVNELLPSSMHYSIADLNHRLLNLRRRGEDKGGLVRKHRRFGGRGSKPR